MPIVALHDCVRLSRRSELSIGSSFADPILSRRERITTGFTRRHGANDVLIFANLASLESVPDGGARVFAGPIRIEGAYEASACALTKDLEA
jgi:hypothetical protein